MSRYSERHQHSAPACACADCPEPGAKLVRRADGGIDWWCVEHAADSGPPGADRV